MNKMKMETSDGTAENIKKLLKLFPECATEVDKNGGVTQGINFKILKQLLSPDVVDGGEAYEFNWVGKKKAIVEANKPIRKTLRPCKEKSKNWDTTENIYIEGDNLEALKLLQESYLGKIDVLYVDPPYNTGKNLIYKNNFFQTEDAFFEEQNLFNEYGQNLVLNAKSNGRFHSDWCSMIYSRLLVASNFLNDSGIIVLTIDDNEIANVTEIMNEVFGEENHLATIIIKNNPSGRSTVTGASIAHEYALFYGKSNVAKLGRLPRNDKQLARYKENDEYGSFEWVNFRKHGGYKEDAPSMFYPIFIKKDGTGFRIPRLEWDDEKREYHCLDIVHNDETVVYPVDETGRERRWKWGLDRARKEYGEMCIRLDKDKRWAVYIKSRMKDEGMLPLTVWDDKKYSSTEYGNNLVVSLMGKKYFDYPKSIYAVEDCIRIACEKDNATVLDFFSGSATTAHAVMNLNSVGAGTRKFILVQLPELCDIKSDAYKDGYKTICDIGEERIRLAGEKIKEKEPLTTPDLDVGFRVFKVDESNMKDIYYAAEDFTQASLSDMASNIKEDRSGLDLLFGCIVDWGLPLSKKYTSEVIDGCTVLNYGDGDLLACFDENIPESVIYGMARKQPLRVVFRDFCFPDSPAKINVTEIFKLLSPDTTIKVI